MKDNRWLETCEWDEDYGPSVECGLAGGSSRELKSPKAVSDSILAFLGALPHVGSGLLIVYLLYGIARVGDGVGANLVARDASVPIAVPAIVPLVAPPSAPYTPGRRPLAVPLAPTNVQVQAQ